MCQLSCGCAHMWFTMQAAKRKRDIWFVWKEIAFWNLWCILWAFHCSCSKSWWGTLPNDWYDFLLRLVRFFLRTQAMLTTEFCNDWYDFFVCEPKNMLFSEFCNDCSFSFCEPNNWVRKRKGNNRCKIRKIACFWVRKQKHRTNCCKFRFLAFFGFAKRKAQIVTISF